MRIGTRSLFSITPHRPKLKIMQRTIDIQSIEIDGKHLVTVSMDGRELRRRGPFPNASTAEIMADRLVQHWLVNLPIDATSNLTENHEFLADLARFSEGL